MVDIWYTVILDMEVRIEENLTFTNADIVATSLSPSALIIKYSIEVTHFSEKK